VTDDAVVLARQRAMMVARLMRILNSEHDSEVLADGVLALIAELRATAGGVLAPTTLHGDPRRLLEELAEQTRAHSERVLEAACVAITKTMIESCQVALHGARYR
jgi:hypothetical protein